MSAQILPFPRRETVSQVHLRLEREVRQAIERGEQRLRPDFVDYALRQTMEAIDCDPLWRDIVKSLPPQDWRPADLPLLTEYILAVTMAEDLGGMIVPKLPLHELQTILGLRDREARRAAALARTLRLAP